MKIDRLIGIITILLQQNKVTAPQLAERFEVSRRTIHRDIEDICKAGIPLITAQGYGGGITIAEGYKIDKSFFTEDELQTVFAALKGIDSVSKTSYLKNLSEKLSQNKNTFLTENMILIDLASHYQIPLTEKIDTIKKAIWTKHCLSFRYYSQKGEQNRQIEPYRLVFQWSSWYVFGYCLDRQAFRLFKLNRLWDAMLTEEHFTGRSIPKEALHFGSYPETNRFHLKALFHHGEKHRLIEEYGMGCYAINENDFLLFEWDFASYENMRQWVFSFGDQVQVLAPPQLIEDWYQQAENILRRKSH